MFSKKNFLCLAIITLLILFCNNIVYSNLPYFQIYQALPTTAGLCWEYFEIGNDKYMAISNGKEESKIYKLSKESFIEVQSISTTYSKSVKSFTIYEQIFLAFADTLNIEEGNSNVNFYKWDGNSFINPITINVERPADIEYFYINDNHYIVIAEQAYHAIQSYPDSKIYKWNNEQQSFIFDHKIDCSAEDIEIFNIDGRLYLGASNSACGKDSKVYIWDEDQFITFQTLEKKIEETGSHGFEFFSVNNESYLAAVSVSAYCDTAEQKTFNTKSIIYKYIETLNKFEIIQTIDTYGAKDCLSFKIDDQIYLVIANHFNDNTSYETNSYIYRWNGFQFEKINNIPIKTYGASKLETFTMNDEIYLAVANQKDNTENININSVIYKITQSNEKIVLNNVKSIKLDGMTQNVSENYIIKRNIRIESDFTNFNDYVSIEYFLNLNTLQFIPLNYNVIKDVGIFSDKYSMFAKNVNSSMYIVTPNGETLEPDNQHSINVSSNDTYSIILERGSVVEIKIRSNADIIELNIDKPDGKLYVQHLITSNIDYTFDFPVLEGGIYHLRLIPQHESSVPIQLKFHNNNSHKIETITSHSYNLNCSGNEYSKYKIYLNKGEVLTVTSNSSNSNNIILNLLDSNSQRVETVKGNMNVKIQNTGDYYLFVLNTVVGSFDSYYATLKVTSDSNINNYPVISEISNQTIAEKELFSLQVTSTNNPIFSAIGLPIGLSISDDGLISGTPLVDGIFQIKINAQNNYGFDDKTFLLMVVNDDRISLKKIIHNLKVLCNM